MVFYGTELPDFTRVSYTNKKSTSKGAFYQMVRDTVRVSD